MKPTFYEAEDLGLDSVEGLLSFMMSLFLQSDGRCRFEMKGDLCTFDYRLARKNSTATVTDALTNFNKWNRNASTNK